MALGVRGRSFASKRGITLNRRQFIEALGATGAVTLGARRAGAAATPSLKQVGASKGLLVGSCIAMKYFDQQPSYRDLFLSQCSIATPEIHMKWNSMSNQPGVYNFSNADKLVSFCDSNGIKVRGHTLVWHDSLPAWVTSQISTANGRKMMLDHIHAVAGHFAGRVYSWDVVNEVLDPASGRPDGLRNSTWLQNAGIDYIENAFRATAATDSKALLIWNENYLEVSNGYGTSKRKAMLSLLDQLLARRVPIHGIGLESHLRGEQANVLADAGYRSFLGELAQRGMQIFITELDVQDATFPADVPARDKMVGDLYRRFLGATLEQKAVRGVITWGLSDQFSWIGGYRPRSDGASTRPLPFDANLQPTPAFYAMEAAIQAAPSRSSS